MDRVSVIEELSHQIESLTRLDAPSTHHSMKRFQDRKENILTFIRNNRINVRGELTPEILYLYRRYFD